MPVEAQVPDMAMCKHVPRFMVTRGCKSTCSHRVPMLLRICEVLCGDVSENQTEPQDSEQYMTNPCTSPPKHERLTICSEETNLLSGHDTCKPSGKKMISTRRAADHALACS